MYAFSAVWCILLQNRLYKNIFSKLRCIFLIPLACLSPFQGTGINLFYYPPPPTYHNEDINDNGSRDFCQLVFTWLWYKGQWINLICLSISFHKVLVAALPELWFSTMTIILMTSDFGYWCITFLKRFPGVQVLFLIRLMMFPAKGWTKFYVHLGLLVFGSISWLFVVVSFYHH